MSTTEDLSTHNVKENEGVKAGFYLSEDGEWVPDGWRNSNLEPLLRVQSGYAFKSSEFKDAGIPVLKIKDISSGKVTLDDVQFYKGDLSKLKRFVVHSGDILVSMTGSHAMDTNSAVAKFARNHLSQPTLLNQRVGNLFPLNEDTLYKNFFYYWVSRASIQKQLGNVASGSANQANISPSNILDLRISLPPLLEQKAIATVLGSLDDKIELLREQNETLEALAQTLFKRWFIDFNFPDQNGNPYKDSGGKISPSELGEIPDGWRVGKLSDLGKVITGKTPSKSNQSYWGENFDFVTPTDFKKIGMFSSKVDRKLSLIGWNAANKLQLPENAILVTCIGSDMGKVTIARRSCITNQQLNSLIPNTKNLTGYLYQFLCSKYEMLRIVAMGGSTMPILNKTDFSSILLTIPEPNILNEFSLAWSALSVKIKSNTQQTQTLIHLRDTLLPKLMKGEIRIK